MPSTGKGRGPNRSTRSELARRAAEDHFFGGVGDGEDVAVVVVVVELLPAGVAIVSVVVDDDEVDGVPLVEVGSVAGLLSPPPHAIARAASAERTMSFFMI